MAPDEPKAADSPKLVAIVPCRNEERTVGKVVSDLLAHAAVDRVVVVDNASSDETARRALAAGAQVIRESRPGKGLAVVAGFRAIADADLVLLVDGDDTYPIEALDEMLREVGAGAEMVIGTRLQLASDGAFRPGHDAGNRLFNGLVRLFFGLRTADLFSGFRLFSRRYVESVPLLASGFEIELELSLRALANQFRVAEVPVRYRGRPQGSESKLRTYRDGFLILESLVAFFRDYRPMVFFGGLAALLVGLSLAFGSVVVREYLSTGLVYRLPLAVLSAALFLLGALSFACGALLAAINRRTAELAAMIRGGIGRGSPPD